MFPLALDMVVYVWLSLLYWIAYCGMSYIAWAWMWSEITVMFMLLIDESDMEYWLLIIDYSTWVVTALSILMPVVFGVFPCRSESLISEWYVLYIVILVFSYWALAHGCCFDPQIKVKARPTTSELGDRGGLYMWAGGIRISMCGVVLFYVLSLDDFC